MRRRRRPPGEVAALAAYGIVLVTGVVVFGFPLYWMVRGSLIDQAMWMRVPLVWLPPLRSLSLKAFASVFTSPQFRMSRVLLNTAAVAVLIMGLNVVFDCMAGFALSKMRMPGKKLVLAALLITIMVPFEGMMVPLYLTVTRIGLADTMLGIILPGAASAFSIILMWRFFNSVPDEMIEAAAVDGASWGQILLRVAMPAAAPAIATIAVFSFLAGWESFVWPMLITDPQSRFDVLQKVIANATYVSMGGTTETEWAYLMAAALISTLPVLALFLLFQRFFIAGLTAGSVKG
jgi:ABC-type glycerol-3-phosphate transport system permease component